MNYQNFETLAAALVFMLTYKGEFHNMRCVNVTGCNKWHARVYWDLTPDLKAN